MTIQKVRSQNVFYSYSSIEREGVKASESLMQLNKGFKKMKQRNEPIRPARVGANTSESSEAIFHAMGEGIVHGKHWRE